MDILCSHRQVLWQVLGLVVVMLTGAAYLCGTPPAMLWKISRQLGLLVAMLAVSALAWPVAGSSLVIFWLYIGIMAGATLSMRRTTIVVLILAVGMLVQGTVRNHLSSAIG